MLVIPAGFSQVTLDFTLPAPGGVKTMSTTFGIAEEARATMLESVAELYSDVVWGVLGTNEGRMTGGTVRDSLSTYEYAMAVDGPGTASLAPPNVTLLVKKVTSGAGRKNRGRMYPPGLVYEGTYNNAGVMSNSDVAEYNAAFADFVAGLEDLAAPMVILHNDETAPTPVGVLAVQPIAATQRRRLR